jgi:hypothetical protein
VPASSILFPSPVPKTGPFVHRKPEERPGLLASGEVSLFSAIFSATSQRRGGLREMRIPIRA